jgi:hypothetical protein
MYCRMAGRLARVLVVASAWAVWLTSAPRAEAVDAPPAAVAPAPPPDAASTARAEALVSELFEAELAARGATERLALSRRFREQAAAGADEAAVRYVLLRRAGELAADAGDVGAALAAADDLAAAFRVDAAALKLETLERAAGAAKSPPAATALTAAACELGEDATARGELGAAAKASAIATTASSRSRDPTVAARAKALARRVTQARTEQRQFEAATQALEKNPDDPRANLAAGRYLAATRNDWARAVPMLAKASEPAIRALAEKERAAPTEPDAMVALGDAWWDLPDGRGGFTQAQARQRAGHWYEKALAELKGVARMPVEARLTELRLAMEARDPRLALRRLQRETGRKSSLTSEGLELRERTKVMTPEEHRVPLRIDLVAKTENDNLRLFFGDRGEVIFNWELNGRELRVHDPATGAHKGFAGKGAIKPNQWAAITWLIEPKRMVIAVDGEQRAVIEGDYAAVRGNAGVGAVDSTVTVKSWRVAPVTGGTGR